MQAGPLLRAHGVLARHLARAAALAIALLPACGDDAQHGDERGVLVFTRTLGYRHGDSIEASTRVLAERLAGVTITEDAAMFADLSAYRGVVFLYTTGNDVLDAAQKTELERFVRGGGGFAGIHSATDTEYEWPFYEELVVARFASHPVIQEGTMDVEDRSHPAMAVIPAGRWVAPPPGDEWYNFTRNPRDVAGVQILATIDEASYAGGTMGADHPMIWAHANAGGRCFYSAIGHVAARWSEDPVFVDHVVAGVRWAIGDD